MNKLSKIILVNLLIIFGFGFLSINFVWAGNNIVIEPSEGIFEVENFFPGHSVISEVKIKNESEINYDKEIALGGERISELEDYDLAEVITLKIIKEGVGETEKTLVELLNGEELILPGGGIGAYEEKEYEFIATFNKGVGNEYANKDLEFDFLFFFRGFEEELNGEPDEIIAVSGISGALPLPKLTIYEEQVREVEVGEDFVTITWNTNLPAFGRIIYDVRPNQFNFAEGEPSYGYAFYTPKTEKQDTFHLITLTGLNLGTTYYYRVVSYASLAISREFSFTTAGVRGEEIVFHPSVPDFPLIPEVYAEDIEEDEEREEDIVSPEEEKELEEEEEEEKSYFEKSLATIGAIPFNLRILLIIVFFILIGLIVLRLTKKKRKNL